MGGTIAGGKKAAATNKAKYGDDFYRNIGHKGGSKSHPETRAFTTNQELAKRAGAKGGRISRRGKSEPKDHQKEIRSHFDLYGWKIKK